MKTVKIKENSPVAKIAAWKLRSHNVAIVFGRTIHLYGVTRDIFVANEKWLRHELRHVQQFEQHGYFPFLIKYLWHSMLEGYHNCRYEKQARQAENDDTILALYKIEANNNLA